MCSRCSPDLAERPGWSWCTGHLLDAVTRRMERDARVWQAAFPRPQARPAPPEVTVAA